MAIFRRSRQQPVEERAATLASLQAFADRSGLTTAGVVVDPDRAIRLSAVWAAIELIAGVGSSMPLDEYRSVAGQQQQLPLSTVFADPDPDPSVSAVAFRAQMLRSAATRGNAYAQVLGVESGRPTGLVSIHPDRVTWKWEKQGDLWQWSVYVDGQRRERWPMGDLFHFALFQQPGSPIGLSPVEYHKQSIGAALAAQRFGQQFFDGGGNPSIILRPPVRLSPDEARALKQQVTDVTRGTREPLVMPREIEIEKMSVPAEDSQFLETQRYGVEEIARVFLGGFPELIGGSVSGSAITYANREQRNADWISLSLAPRYLIPFEQALSTLVPTGCYVKHNVDALLRSDLAARYASYKTSAEVSAIMGAPLLTINDMRRLENMPPIEGGDTYPQPASAPVMRDSQPDQMERHQHDLQQIMRDSIANRDAAAEQRDARIIEALRHITSRQEPAQVTVNLPEIQLRESDALPRAIEALAPAISEQRQLAADQLEAIRLLAETMPAPVVNVTTPDVTVNVQPADVQVNVPDQPAPVVNVQAADVQPTIVVQPADVPATRKRVIYDRQGRVSEVVEEQT
jgi:HK97 family phage portal protein